MVGILSHPERNHGIISSPRIAESLVDSGCLLQVTSGSLTGQFGPDVQQISERFLRQGLVHFLATDAHNPRVRRPQMRRAFNRVHELADWETAVDLCCRNPALVARGQNVAAGRRRTKRRGLVRWLGLRRAG
jgi:protein-tyrosine phosphatase